MHPSFACKVFAIRSYNGDHASSHESRVSETEGCFGWNLPAQITVGILWGILLQDFEQLWVIPTVSLKWMFCKLLKMRNVEHSWAPLKSANV